MYKDFNKLIGILEKNNNFLITSHVNLDGDAIGSELAFYLLLKKLNKKSTIINQDKLPIIYDFLPESNKINNLEDYNSNRINFDVAIILDCSNLIRVGEISKIFKDTITIINIDHHGSNENFGNLNYIDSSASSVGEIIYNLIDSINISLLDQKISSCLYTAIITDTGSFRYSNVSPETFKIASDLICTGMNTYSISNNIYNRNTFSGLKLLGKALLTLEMNNSSGVSWLSITRRMLSEVKANDDEIEGIIDLVTTLKNTEISILFRETVDNKIKISFRSKGNFNVSKFAGKFNGGGHPNSAGCLCQGKLAEVKKIILSELCKEIEFLKNKNNYSL